MKISTLFIASNLVIVSAMSVSHARTFEESPASPTTQAVSQSSTPTEKSQRAVKEPNSYVGLAFGRANVEFPDYGYEPEGNIGGVYLGTDINKWLGLETAFMVTGDIAVNSNYEAAAGYWSFTPTVRLQLTDNVNFYVKGGFAAMAYVEPDYPDDDLTGWVGTAGAGVRAQFTDINIRFGIDYLTGSLEPERQSFTEYDVDMMVFTGGIEYRF